MARRGRITRPFTIREYQDSDEAQVVELVRELQQHEAPLNQWAKAPEEIGPWYIEEVKKWCAKQEGIILLAEHEARLLGYATVLCTCEEDGADGDFAYLYALVAHLVVTESARGEGIGKALLEACERLARAKARPVLRIGVLSGNLGALQAYQKFGFTPYHLKLEKLLA